MGPPPVERLVAVLANAGDDCNNTPNTLGSNNIRLRIDGSVGKGRVGRDRIEVGALEKLDDVVVTKNSLQTRLDVVEKEVKATLESAHDILALEKGAREELDQALTTHAKQLA